MLFICHHQPSQASQLPRPTANNEQNKDEDSSEEDDESLVLPDPHKAAGWQKGTTKEKKRQDVVSKKLCTDAIVAVMVKEHNDRKAERNKVAKGFLDSPIKAKKRIEFCVSADISKRDV